MTGLYRTPTHYTIVKDGQWFQADIFSLDGLFQSRDPAAWVEEVLASAEETGPLDLETTPLLPPVENQEIWAAGVTYFRSREARMEEAEKAGGDIFYDKVYEAERPELFMKATARRARGHLHKVCVRSDSDWDVPEPELTLAINSGGDVFGYTIGNDMSSRSIEGENPLYLPQAKVYRGSCAVGPGLILMNPPAPETAISLEIARDGKVAFTGETQVSQIKRRFEELAEFLFRDNEFPEGALLMTGTGIVPPPEFTLRSGDIVSISIDNLGTLRNEVE